MTGPFVIAEIGSCHDGSLDLALDLMTQCALAGASAVKAQYWSSSRRMVERRRAPEYEQAYEAGRVPESWLPILARHAQDVGVEFMCTSYLPEDVDTVARFVRTFKVASFEAEDGELLRAHRPHLLRPDTRVLVSCGMQAKTGHVYTALGSPHPWDRVLYLHCVSAYPATLRSLRLAHAFHGEDPMGGFSDHSDPSLTITGALAVAAGARILERHVRHRETRMSNEDYCHSMLPGPFSEYVAQARQAWEATYGEPERDEEAALRRYKVVAP